MKRIYIAAGALLIGTSAFALAPSSAPVARDAKAPIAAPAGKAAEVALVAKSNDLPKVEVAALADGAKTADASKALDTSQGDPDLDLAVKPEPAATAVAAADSYPPCRPGPGDDHCIQLYEPGVPAALASWNAAHADTQLAANEAADPSLAAEMGEATGVGGPYEPVDAAALDGAMNGDGSVDLAAGETAELEHVAQVAQSDYTGVGGPLEEVQYPPCRPGPGDDRCIQLYEPGVTGG